MVALSISQTSLLPRVSKPSAEVSGKHESEFEPEHRGTTFAWISAKRKRDDDDSIESLHLAPYKKPKLSLPHTRGPISGPTPIISTTESTYPAPNLSLVFHNLSQPIRTLIKLHSYFLQALSIHYAHTRIHAPAELGRVLETITRLWKERSVTQEDVQKMLAIYEMSATVASYVGGESAQSSSPFRLATAGSCKSIEFTGQRKEAGGLMSTSFIEKALHDSYRSHVYALDSAWTRNRYAHLSFFDDGALDNFPKLAFSIGTQTAARKANTSQHLADILKLSNAAQLRNAKTSTPTEATIAEELSNKIGAVENRKQSLLDRIEAKQLASKLKGKPTAQQVLREHALGKITYVTDILRMMQQQRKAESKSKIYDHTSSDFSSANRSGKVSFSLAQIRDNTKSSSTVPISDHEVKMCLKMLSEELDGTWVKMIERGVTSKAVFVVLEGEGLSGKEVKRRLTTREV